MSAPDQNGWMPIETAPTEGVFLIAYADGMVRAGHFLDNSHTKWPWKGVRPLHGAERSGNPITHWQPLPKPPVPLP